MPFRCKYAFLTTLIFAMLLGDTHLVFAAKSAPLSQEEMALSEKLKPNGLPLSSELFAALDKLGKPAWSSLFRDPIPTNFTNRAQIAFNLGGLIADGYIAVAAQDGQQVKNMGRDMMALAKGLGVGQNIMIRGNSIAGFAEDHEWDSLMEDLEATQNDIQSALSEQQDEDLIPLINLGVWLRSTQAVAKVIRERYSPEKVELLRQPALAEYFKERLEKLSPRLSEDQKVQSLQEKLKIIRETFNSGELSEEKLEKLYAITSEVMTTMSQSQPTP